MTRRLLPFGLIASALLGAACTVSQSAEPTLTGPSEFATSISVTATPDTLNQDGASQSAIVVTAHGPTGQVLPGLSVRVDMAVGGVMQDFGTLSARNIVTGSDGRATAVYTAAAAPPPSASGSVRTVSILASALGSNTQSSQAGPSSASIRLVPAGVILPPAGTPTAAFVISPTPVALNVPSLFDASSSSAGSNASQITSYQWSFGDGGTANARTVNHTSSAQGTFTVVLTVTNDRGLSASASQTITVGVTGAPTAAFVFSPSQPATNQTVVFNADTSKSAVGHNITLFNWNFGDGGTASGITASHAFAVAGTYAVTLSVLDDTGQRASTSQTVTVGSGGVSVSAPVAKFVFSPASPGINQDVFFNASSSTVQAGHTLTYAWDFGDGNTGSGVTPSHPYGRAGSFTVTLLVTDDTGQQNTTSAAVTVSAASAQIVAAFDFSPTNPGVGTQVFFDATASSSPAPGGITSYAWDFGDGTSGVGKNPPFKTYAAPATYVVRLTVMDGLGNSATTTLNVTVSP